MLRRVTLRCACCSVEVSLRALDLTNHALNDLWLPVTPPTKQGLLPWHRSASMENMESMGMAGGEHEEAAPGTAGAPASVPASAGRGRGRRGWRIFRQRRQPLALEASGGDRVTAEPLALGAAAASGGAGLGGGGGGGGSSVQLGSAEGPALESSQPAGMKSLPLPLHASASSLQQLQPPTPRRADSTCSGSGSGGGVRSRPSAGASGSAAGSTAGGAWRAGAGLLDRAQRRVQEAAGQLEQRGEEALQGARRRVEAVLPGRRGCQLHIQVRACPLSIESSLPTSHPLSLPLAHLFP